MWATIHHQFLPAQRGKLNINVVDEFEKLVIAYVREGCVEVEAIERLVQRYSANHRRLEVGNAPNALIERLRWDVNSTADDELLSEAKEIISRIHELSSFTVSVLHDLVGELKNGQLVASGMADAWIMYSDAIKKPTQNRRTDWCLYRHAQSL